MDCQKHLFSLPADHHYINCSYLSPLLKKVEEAGIKGIKSKNRPWETTPDQFFTQSNSLRSVFAKLINAGQQDITIMPAVSYGMATVAKNIDPNKGSKIIVTGEQFPSNIYAWRRFSRQHNCHIEVVEPPKAHEGRGKKWNERILDAIDKDTLMVAIANVHWTDGTLFDLKEISRRVAEYDSYFVIDGTQSVGALPIDVEEVKPDALICAGYKWLMGPYAMALGYFSPRLQSGVPLEEGWIVREGSEDFSSLVDYVDSYQPGAQRFDMGERSNFILVPMMIAALEQILEWTPEAIQQYCQNLSTDLVHQLPEYGYQIEDPEWRGQHMFGIRLPQQVTISRLQQKLDERNIHVSVRGSAVRIAPNVYNDKEDMQALLEVLTSLVK